MGSTTKGFPYPDPTARVNQGYDAIQDLAEAVDSYISTPGPYTAFAYTSPFVSNGGVSGYRKSGDLIILRGSVRRSDTAVLATSTGIPFATLPVGFRPVGGTKLFPISTNSASIMARLSINTAGVMQIDTPSTSGITVVTLDGVSFDVRDLLT